MHQYSNNPADGALVIEDDQDPYDSLLLTNRPTSVVTQSTMMLDTSPDMYGDQKTEQDLFNTVGADGGARRRAATAQQDDDLAADTGTAPAAAKPGVIRMPVKKSEHWGLILGLVVGAAVLGGGTLFALKHFRHKRR